MAHEQQSVAPHASQSTELLRVSPRARTRSRRWCGRWCRREAVAYLCTVLANLVLNDGFDPLGVRPEHLCHQRELRSAAHSHRRPADRTPLPKPARWARCESPVCNYTTTHGCESEVQGWAGQPSPTTPPIPGISVPTRAAAGVGCIRSITTSAEPLSFPASHPSAIS